MGIYGYVYNFTQQKSANKDTRESTICMKYDVMCYLAGHEKSFVDNLIEDNGWSKTDLIVFYPEMGYHSMLWMDGKLYNSDINVLDYLDFSEDQKDRVLPFLQDQRDRLS